jgi:hypothetical protein
VCFASERPSTIKLDNNGKIHSENGPAIVYPDGWPIWAHHGVMIPEKVMTNPNKLTFEEVSLERNEVVKLILKKIGIEKFLAINGTQPGAWNWLFKEIARETMNT